MQRFPSVRSINETDSERQIIAASQAVKPLPPLPRGWSRVCHETGLFLRGIGLGIVVTFFQGLFTKNFPEPEKVAIRRSRVTALLRTLIHAVPVGVAIFEIVLNLKGRFVGKTFDKQSYLQFAAKAHEIAMQASIATILLSYIRYQVSTGKGMPFGAVLGGLQFLQVSYLWSVELWSSILSKDFQLRKKTCFAVLVLICITVAATAGPSSASLLIARQDLWPTALKYLAVNASVLDIWPDRLDEKISERDCAVVRFDSLDEEPDCPMSDLYLLLDTDLRLMFSDWGLHDTYSLQLQSPRAKYARYLLMSLCGNAVSGDQHCASVPQTGILDGFFSEQEKHTQRREFVEGYQFMHNNYYQPYTIASCVADVVKDASDQAPLRFARISENDSELKKDREIFSIPGLTKGHMISNLSGNKSDFRVDWVDLPMDVFDTGVPGVVIVNPQDPNGLSYNITTCTLNAGWGSSALVSSSEIGSVYSHMFNLPSSWPSTRVTFDAYGYLYSNTPNFKNSSNFSFPQRRISISKDWMDLLNPTVVLPSNLTGTYISLALSSMQSKSTEASSLTEATLARLLTLLLTSAIADTGKGHNWEVFSDLKSATGTCDTCLVFELEYSKFGWLYSPSGTATKLAITVMFAYCALVLGHIIYSAVSGVSSTAWDSAAELVVLAMNSSPTEILQNTCAGLIGRQALKTPVKVLVTTPGHLELVFGEVKDPKAQTSQLVMNEKYGKLTVEGDTGDKEPEFNAQGTLRKRAVTQSLE